MLSSRAVRGVRRSMRCEPERISIAFALELHGAQLRKAFDVVAEGDEGVDSFQQERQAHRARREVERARGGVEADAGDLAGAHGDGEVNRRFVVADHAFDVDALVSPLEGGKATLAEHQPDHHRHAAARDLGGQARRVVREEVAQDDPEPFHVGSIGSGFGPADSNGLRPTSLWAWCLILLEAVGSFPPDLQWLFPRIWPHQRCHPRACPGDLGCCVGGIVGRKKDPRVRPEDDLAWGGRR